MATKRALVVSYGDLLNIKFGCVARKVQRSMIRTKIQRSMVAVGRWGVWRGAVGWEGGGSGAGPNRG